MNEFASPSDDQCECVSKKNIFFRKSYDDTKRNKNFFNKHLFVMKKIEFEFCVF